ncbi:MAG TPA: FAD-binding oxidoreductase [Pseudonocardiaceae bacterium]|jgi:FAD/FMN-containing dehydrogenase|nr:FAD-binding oxidoreductase [Pseudonocardiaceae bacterium]
MTEPNQYRDAVARLQASYRAIPAGAPVRLAKRTSNLFRLRPPTGTPGLDVSGLTGVLEVDPATRTAEVAGMCRYVDLVAATLPHGLTPLVVPQLKTITLGGAVSGLGIESASFRNGLPHESVLELDVLTGTGELVTSRPGDDLFAGFPNSYGTLGYATRLRIELEPVRSHVALRHVRFDDLDVLCAAVAQIMATRVWDGEDVDYLDGVMFTPTECYLTLGRRTSHHGPASDYTGQQIYYRSLQRRRRDLLTTHDYLWRWDTDWFWCSRAFGAQHPVLRKLWPATLRRSDVYWKIVALDRRLDLSNRLEVWRGRPRREPVIQDVEIPVERTAEFLRWFAGHVPIEPVWLCPIRLRGERRWPLYPLEPGRDYINVGFWSTVPIAPGGTGSDTNRAIEDQVHAVGGHKSLYSDSFYSRADFDARYGGEQYAVLKERYDPDRRLLDLYTKAVRRR